MNIKKLQKEVLDIIEDLRGLGAEINVEEFETLASSEDEDALNILRNVVKGMRDEHASRSRKQARATKREEEEDIEPAQPDDEEDAEDVDDQDAEDDDSEVEEDGDRKIDDDTDDEEDDEEVAPKVAMPLSVKTKLATTVKIATNEDVEEYYALLLKLKRKIEALESVKDDNEDDKLLIKLLAQTYKAYDAAMEHLEDLADDTFPTKLERFGNEAKKALIAELSEQGEDGKKKYFFDTKNASFSRFVRIADASVAYSYVLTLRKVKDSSGYVFPEYVLIVTQKMHLSEEDQERGLPAKPRFHVTRLLRDNPNYELGNEFKTTAELITRIKKMLAYDNLRTDIEKINIPFTRKELSKKFLSEHVRSVKIDDDEHKIVVLLKKGTTQEDIDLLIPDFMRNLGAIVNQKKLAIKYHVNVTTPSIEFVIIHKTKDKGVINRSQLEDMRDRYDLPDETFRSLVRFLNVGN